VCRRSPGHSSRHPPRAGAGRSESNPGTDRGHRPRPPTTDRRRASRRRRGLDRRIPAVTAPAYTQAERGPHPRAVRPAGDPAQGQPRCGPPAGETAKRSHMPTVDARLLDAARESVNFGPLVAIEPLLTIYGAGAESSVYTDPNGALIKCRQFGEVLAVQLIRRSGTRFDGSTQFERIKALEHAGVLTKAATDALHAIRTYGNEATHSHLFNVHTALQSIKQCWELGNLLRLALFPDDQRPRSFIAPEPQSPPQAADEDDQAELDAIN